MRVGITDNLFCVNLNQDSVDLMEIGNRRFMYHSSGHFILGAEDVVTGKGGKCFKSHAEEYHEASVDSLLPPFDDFIRGWIGVGGSYKNGIIHFAPHIPSENIEMFEKAFDFIEVALENGFSKKAILRGFPGKWEQAIGSVIPDGPSFENVLEDARNRSDEMRGYGTNSREELSL